MPAQQTWDRPLLSTAPCTSRAGVLRGVWNFTANSVADFSGLAAKQFLSCTVNLQGSSAIIEGLLLVNQSSRVVMTGGHATARGDVILSAGDKPSFFDFSATSFTFEGGVLRVLAPITFGNFSWVSGDLFHVTSTTFLGTMRIPKNSTLSCMGDGTYRLSGGVFGEGHLLVAGGSCDVAPVLARLPT